MALKHVLITAFLLNGFSVLAENQRHSKWQESRVLAKNNLNLQRNNAEVCIPLPASFTDPKSVFALVEKASKLASTEVQITDCDGDQKKDEVQLLLDFKPRESIIVQLHHKAGVMRNEQPPRTQAELAVRLGGSVGKDNKLTGGEYVSVKHYQLPQEHFVGDKLFKYEGVGLESDKVAYRYYFDHRGSLDVFGKTKPELVLPKIGVDGSDYHTLAEWGMDVLKVGNSFGLGTPGQWYDNQVVKMSEFQNLIVELDNGVNSSIFTLLFTQWQTPTVTTDAKVQYQINYGDHKVKVIASSAVPLSHWVTGLVNHDLPRIERASNNLGWGYLATYGKQSLAGDNLGLAVFFKQAELQQFHSNNINHTALLKPANGPLTYYFLADWQAGIDGSQNQQTFIQNLDRQLALLNSPIAITQL